MTARKDGHPGGVEQWQLIGLIIQRSVVRVHPPLPVKSKTDETMKRILINAALWTMGIVALAMIFSEDPTGGKSFLDEATTKIQGFALAGVTLALAFRHQLNRHKG